MITNVYFVRHAESDPNVHDDRARPLTEKGMRDRELVTAFLNDKDIEIALSSPYKRAFDTVSHFAERHNLTVHIIEDFRERKISGDWLRDADFSSFTKRQWQDFHYKLSGGESLYEVQNRNIAALKSILSQHAGKRIAIGTHGTSLSTIINYYDSTYGYSNFMDIVKVMPWIVKFTFDADNCVNIEKYDCRLRMDDCREISDRKEPYPAGFWLAMDKLVTESEIMIDRPRGSVHPRYPDFVYPLDYGYLKDTTAMDGGGIDIWRGSDPTGRIDAIVCIIDLMKRDSEIKVLIGCTEEEKAAIYHFSNETEFMKGILIRRDAKKHRCGENEEIYSC